MHGLKLYAVFIVQTFQTSQQYVVPRGGIFLGKWHGSFAGIADSKMNVQSASAQNTRYITDFCKNAAFLVLFYVRQNDIRKKSVFSDYEYFDSCN
jgi:hypothetical protein